jgi:hypothetical protein
MTYEPSIHTYAHLIENKDTLTELIIHSDCFCKSDLCENDVFLKELLCENTGDTVAHTLALNNSTWLKTQSSMRSEIISLKNHDGFTVAHYLAVRHVDLLLYAPASNIDILTMKNNVGYSVALSLLRNNENSIYHTVFYDKRILSLSYRDKILAEEFVEIFTKTHGLSHADMAVKLIEQGAAYKPTRVIELDVGEEVFNRINTFVKECMEPLTVLRQLIALYSTASHNVFKLTQRVEALQKKPLKQLNAWTDILDASEKLLSNHVYTNTHLLQMDHFIDIECQPGHDMMKRIAHEINIKSSLNIEFPRGSSDMDALPPAQSSSILY